MTVAGAPADKPARLVAVGDAIVVHGPKAQFVSRGGEKLDAALERFGIDVHDRRALDAGASTGGFTDCLLQRGAREVVAVDVGYGQLHEHLRADPRVRNVERCNIRSVDPDDLGAPFEIVVADLSFISLDKVLDVLIGLAGPAAPIVVLVKPQFEAARHEASRGRGVITEPAVWRRVLDEVMSAFEGAGRGHHGRHGLASSWRRGQRRVPARGAGPCRGHPLDGSRPCSSTLRPCSSTLRPCSSTLRH